MEILTIFAIVSGPILAIVVSRHLDKQRERDARRMEIFRTLMRTRRTPMWPDHVGALNLVEIEFKDDEVILSAWKELFEHFAKKHARGEDEVVSEATPRDEINKRDKVFYDRLARERQTLLAKLLHAIAKRMNFKAEQLEIFEGGYTPQGWEEVEIEQRAIRRFAIDLYLGRATLPVNVTGDPRDIVIPGK